MNLRDKKINDLKTYENQKHYVHERAKTYSEIVETISNLLSHNHSDLTKDSRETIRNLSIVSGAIATFSIMFLGQLESMYFLGGVFLLLVVVMMSFAYLVGSIDKSTRYSIKFKRKFLYPVQKMSKNCIDFFRQKKNFDSWLLEDKAFKENKYDELTKDLDLCSREEEKLDYTIDIITVIFILANSLIIYAFLEWKLVPILTNWFLGF